MSTSPSSLPGSDDTDQDRVPPGGQDVTPGDATPNTPPSSPNDPNKLTGLIDVTIPAETENTRGITPGIEDSGAVGMVREIAEGISEKEQHSLSRDIDKDIDAVLDYKIEKDQVNPESSMSITVNTTADIEVEGNSDRHNLLESNEAANKSGILKTDIYDRGIQEAGSEKSFTSDTDTSSVLAESVVKKAISNAVDIVKSEDRIDSVIDRLESEIKVKESDVKVGLFQYQEYTGGEEDEEEEEKNEFDNKNEINYGNEDVRDQPEEQQKDSVVGLFQYADLDREKSPVVSEIDDENDDDDQFESMNEEEKTNILKLYGLEGEEPVSPVSPKSASPSESGTNSLEEKNEKKIFDVQRDVYEPSTRHFSITRDTSSNESTPRAVENGNTSEKLEPKESESKTDIWVGADMNLKHDIDADIEREIESGVRSDSLISGADMGESDLRFSIKGLDVKSEDKNARDENAAKALDYDISHSISPPLVQYEPVKENGKFRIVKTSKEGGGSSFSSIRVGGDVISPKESPRSTESQKQTGAGIESKEKKQMDSLNESQENILSHSSGEIKSKRLGETSDKQQLTKNESPQNTELSKNVIIGYESTQVVELDREKIRKLLENETAQTRSTTLNDSAVSKDLGFQRSHYSSKEDNQNIKHGERRNVTKVGSPPERDRDLSQESDLSRIRYMTRDTVGREVNRLGPKPYDVKEERDRMPSNSRFMKVEDDRSQYYREEADYQQEKHFTDRERAHHDKDKPSYDKDRYASEDLRRPEVSNEYKQPSSSSYEEELLRRAYDRVSHQHHDKGQTVPAVRSHESSAIIPGFKTLQDQQAKWSDMFHKIEDEHRMELRSQYDRHQYNIQRLQQQMELELQKQHLAIRKKLDIHKEALAKMSPDRVTSARLRSPDRSLSPEQVQRSQDRVSRSPERSKVERSIAGHSGEHIDVSTLQSSFDSKSWREIYREVREEEEQGHSSPKPLKRTLDSDFSTLDSTIERSRPSGERSSPRGRSDFSGSGGRDHSREVVGSSSERTHPSAKLSKAERDMSLGKSVKVSSRQRSPEGRDSRSFERESIGRDLVPPLHLPDGASQDGVSRHVQELLDNLNDSRHSLHDLEDDVTSGRPLPHHVDRLSERPRAGVYSSPMPLFSSSRSLQKSTEKLGDSTLTSIDNSHFTQSLPVGRDRAEFDSDRPRTTGGRDRSSESMRTEDSLSPSTRMNLREKHAKHLNDLRTYYEEELRELRKALSDTMDASTVSVNTSLQSSSHDPILEAENRQLSDKCRMLEDEMEEVQKHVRTLEQKNYGLEKRASEYAAAYADSQTMSVQHRAHIEELQRYCRERDDLINELESKMVSNDDSVKIYKKNLDEEIELHRQDKIALQRMMDRYESLEREYKLLQETMSTTENKLYESRTEIVELNRTISKLELENKRLGRENDNLRHKVTQSLNLSALHESFGSPSSPRDVQNILSSHSPASAGLDTSLSQSHPPDSRVPGFATSMKDWTPTQKSRPKSAETNRSRTEELNTSRQSVSQKEKKISKSKRKEGIESSKGRQSDKGADARNIPDDSSLSSSREDVTNRSKSRRKEADDRPVRDTTSPRKNLSPARREITPPRSTSPSSQAESEVSDYSPLLKAERELFKLRDMMRQAVAVKPSSSPPPIKLQKKFYGSERPTSTDDYTPDLGVQRGRKEKPSISSHSSVVKTKSSQTPVKSDKASSKRQSSVKSEKSSKSKNRGSSKDQEHRERGKDNSEREKGRQREKTPPRREELVDTSTRFDIDFNEANKSVTVSQRKVDNQSGKHKNLTNGEAGDQSTDIKGGKNTTKDSYSGQGAESQVENTLDMMRHGHYTTRPEWENIYTSLAKPKSETQAAPRNMEEKVKDRLRTIAEMESRYDGLQVEKRQLESSINKIPLHGRVDRNNRKHKEELENKLDAVERELGSLRMTLKRYNVLKTAG